MKNWMRFGVLFAACAIALIAPASAATSDVTVGQFLIEVAKAKNLAATDSVVAESSLRTAGASLPRLDHSKLLTQGDVAAISLGLGLRLTTSNPLAGFTRTDVDSYLATFGPELGSSTTQQPQGVHPPPGGWKKGHNKTPSDPQ